MRKINIIILNCIFLIVPCIQSMGDNHLSKENKKVRPINTSLLTVGLLSLSNPAEIVDDPKDSKEEIFSPRKGSLGIQRNNIELGISYEPEDSLADYCKTYIPPAAPQCHLKFNKNKISSESEK